jgi:superfamily I DNA and RNA helicase
MDIFPRNYQFHGAASAQRLLEHLKAEQETLGLQDAIVFCEFPLFREDEEVMLSQLLVISEKHGVVIFGAYSGLYNDNFSELSNLVTQTEAVFSHVYSKLIKSPRLRKNRTTLNFDADACVYAPEAEIAQDKLSIDTPVFKSLGELSNFLEGRPDQQLDKATFSEIVSVVEGSKGLIRVKERKTDSFSATSKVALIKALEEEIRRFDRDQRLCYMTEVFGPQRITGLAGSGKTIVIAMQAALAHLKNPEARIAVTFYTKSLYQHIKQLITRFYRQFDDRDPDWDNLRILHAWGGSVNEGLYHYSARAVGEQPLTLSQAAAFNRKRPFDEVCTRLLNSGKVTPLFDYIFVDEAQDFPPSFLRLALKLAVEEKLVIAYDVFQTIFDVEVPTADVIFGTKENGEPLVTFEEDLVLHRCYRNPLAVLVCAHAIGFGLYSNKVVQMLESKEHWEDFGYRWVSGNLEGGTPVEFIRPNENSPISMGGTDGGRSQIHVSTYLNITDEAEAIASCIENDIKNEGLSADDILVICADDRNAKGYFGVLISALASRGIRSHNMQDGSYSIKNFSEKDHVTLSTVYKAKGNEAVAVYVLGIDALFHFPDARSRNTIFTAMTRAKGWLWVSGIGASAEAFKMEVEKAVANVPYLRFNYPDEQQLVRLKRDLSQDGAALAEATMEELERNLNPEDLEQLLKAKLMDLQRRRRQTSRSPARRKPFKF